MNQHIETGLNYIRGIWKYRWYALLLAWVIVIVGWIMVARLPDQYQASARVFVDTDSLLRPLLKGLAIQTNVTHRVRLMTQTLLSRPNLEKVARMTDQDLRTRTQAEMEELLDDMGSKIDLTSTRTEKNLYTISYHDEDPKLAKQTVQSILTIFVESSLGEARKDSDVAQKFLDQQIEEYEAKLVEAENRLTEFKRNNAGMLPGSGGDAFARLQSAEDELQLARLNLKEAVYRRDEIKRQLEDAEESEEGLLSSATTTTLSTSYDARIQLLQTRLDELLLKFTEEHPNIKEIRFTLKQLEKKKQDELGQMAKESVGSSSGENAVHQQLTLSLGQANANLAAVSARVKEYEQRVEKFKLLVNTLPAVETELSRLNRDHAVNKKNYDALLSRRESAKMSDEAEQTGDNVKFKVIDPPRVPSTPSGPNRLLFSSLVLIGGLGAGLVLAFLLSQLRPAVFDRNSLREITGLPVFGSVSRVWTPGLLVKRRMELGAFSVVMLTLIMAYGGVLLLQGGGLGMISSVTKSWGVF